jgi:hypothetical protein
MVAHSLHWHSESLVNAFECVTQRVVQEIMKNQYSPIGPTLGSHKGELSFQTRTPLPYALVAPESHGALAYVIYKLGVTLEITSFSMSRLRKFHMGMHVHTYWTAATRYV